MQTAMDKPYRQVQGLKRGLCILKALNDAESGSATPRSISELTKLNRTTVKRILETMASDGYVLHNEVDGRYSLTPEVLNLSRGLGQHARLLQCAAPVLDAVVSQTGWCFSLATLEVKCMQVRESTLLRSDLSEEREMRKFRQLPMLFSALGRAYLSDCEEEERRHILQRLQTEPDEQTVIARNPRLVEMITHRVREQGYAIQDGDWPGENRYSAVALPVRADSGKTLGSLSITYVRGTASRSKVVEQFLPALRKSTALLAAGL